MLDLDGAPKTRIAVRRSPRTAWLLGALLLASACGSSEPTRAPLVTGTWEGVANARTLRITLTESAQEVTGSGTLTLQGAIHAVTVTFGSHRFPNLTIHLETAGFDQIRLTGTVSTGTITGTLDGFGFANAPVTLTKQ